MMRITCGAALCALLCLPPLQGQTLSPGAQAAAEMETAVKRVQEIVNQPVTRIPMGAEDHAAEFKPGWFHPGANTPDFEKVDVRATQEFAQYARWPYVTSDITPGVMYPGSEVEFNANTKFFYTDRTQPKKRLTEAEMIEINDLYRVIGKCLRRLKDLQSQTGSPVAEPAALGPMTPLLAAPAVPAGGAPVAAPLQAPLASPRNLAALGGVLGLVLLLVLVRRSR